MSHQSNKPRTFKLEGEALQLGKAVMRIHKRLHDRLLELDKEADQARKEANDEVNAVWQKLARALRLPDDIRGSLDTQYYDEHELLFLHEVPDPLAALMTEAILSTVDRKLN